MLIVYTPSGARSRQGAPRSTDSKLAQMRAARRTQSPVEMTAYDAPAARRNVSAFTAARGGDPEEVRTLWLPIADQAAPDP